MSKPPGGTVTFLFTDIEGSTKRWEQYPQQMQAAFSRQEAILRQAIGANDGYAYKMIGDAFQAAFPTALQALHSALDAQRALHAEHWPQELGEVRVRMALHTGVTEVREGDYVGPLLNRVARLLSAGHGGQVLFTYTTYELVRDLLPAGLGLLDLGEHWLKDLYRPEHVFQLVAADLPLEFPSLNSLDNRPNNLPVQATPFIGRDKEIFAVSALLRRSDVRLVTLTGPGGTGKTRLGLQVAAELLDDFPNGVYNVELAALTDPSLVSSTIAQTLGVGEAVGKPLVDSLRDYLRDRQMLLVLDNFEQVVQAASVVGALMNSASHLKVLVTSRINLNLYGEHIYPVPPFELPDPSHLPALERLSQFESVRLFIERAQAAKPDFAVTNDNAPSVAEICVRLDGLPLAIELAAARVRLFPPPVLLSRLSSRMKVLTGGAVNLPARQQTMRATIEWSYELLDEGEKQLFQRMAVFQAGRTLEGLERVCNYDGQLQIDVVEGVESLINHSLLQLREVRGGEPRFWMLETIHEYAREKLRESGEEEELQWEHALYMIALVEEAEPHLRGGKQAEWLHRLEDEHDNLRAALRWARAANALAMPRRGGQAVGITPTPEAAEVGLRIAGALWRFWDVRGYFTEGREQLADMLALPTPSTVYAPVQDPVQAPSSQSQTQSWHSFRVKALNGAGFLARRQGDSTIARSLHEEGLTTGRELGNKVGIATSLYGLASVAWDQGDYATARSLAEESLSIVRELGDKWDIALVLNGLGNLAHIQGDYASAGSLYEESLAIFRELGNKGGNAISLANLGIVAYLKGEYDRARTLTEESLAIRRELGDKRGISNLLNNLGNIAYMEGDFDRAYSLCAESLRTAKEIGVKHGIALGLGGVGEAAIGLGKREGHVDWVEKGAVLLGASDHLFKEIEAVRERDDQIKYEHATEVARAQLGEENFERLRGEGRAMSMEQAIEYALEEMAERP